MCYISNIGVIDRFITSQFAGKMEDAVIKVMVSLMHELKHNITLVFYEIQDSNFLCQRADALRKPQI